MTGGLRRKLRSQAELLRGFAAAFAAQQRDPEKIQRVGIARSEFQRQPEMPLGVGMPAGLEALDTGFQLGKRLPRSLFQNFSAR